MTVAAPYNFRMPKNDEQPDEGEAERYEFRASSDDLRLLRILSKMLGVSRPSVLKLGLRELAKREGVQPLVTADTPAPYAEANKFADPGKASSSSSSGAGGE